MYDWILMILLAYSFTYWLLRITDGRYPPPPPPDRTRLVGLLVGTVGGIAGGWLVNRAFGPTPEPAVSATSFATVTAGVFIGVTVAVSLYNLAGGRRMDRGPQV